MTRAPDISPASTDPSGAATGPTIVEVVAVGDELLSGDTVNSNATSLAARCRALGAELRRAVTVRDRVDEIVEAIARAVATADVCLVTGGLGPTTDDLTTQAIARAAGVELVRDGSAVERLEAKFRAFGRSMPPANLKQADFPAGAEILANPIGSAEGFVVRIGPRPTLVFSMPGVPREMERMMREQVEPRIADAFALRPIARRVYRILGLGESAVAAIVEPIVDEARARSPGLAALFVHYRASMPEVLVILEAVPGASGERATPAELAAFDQPLRAALEPGLYGVGDAGLPQRLVAALTRAGLTIGTAESCTGGGAARRIASIPGASAVLRGAVVAYDDAIKKDLLGVPAALIAEHGAVSEPVARAMAEGARRVLGCDLSVAITGIAGPSGGTRDKPVGTVDFAVSDREGTMHKRIHLRGTRGTVQRAAELWALKLTWDRLRERGCVAAELFESIDALEEVDR